MIMIFSIIIGEDFSTKAKQNKIKGKKLFLRKRPKIIPSPPADRSGK